MTTRRIAAQDPAPSPRIFRRARQPLADLSAKNCKRGPGLPHAIKQMISVADDDVFRQVQLVIVEEGDRRRATA